MRKTVHEEGWLWLEQVEIDLYWTKDLAERGGYHLASSGPTDRGESYYRVSLCPRGRN
jgi:hypothetical protein